MTKGRLEAFSDGVIAILITIMVLELHTPQGADLDALRPLVPVLLSYLLSFVFIGIYWNNHHHMLHLTARVNGKILWANLHLLFWLSLVPFVTQWLGQHPSGAWPTAFYGVLLFCSGVAYNMLASAIIRDQGQGSRLRAAVGRDLKGKASAALYAAAIPLAFVNHWIAKLIYVAVAAMWLVPDPRIEATIVRDGD